MQSFFERATAMAKDLQTSAVSGAQNLEGQFRQVVQNASSTTTAQQEGAGSSTQSNQEEEKGTRRGSAS